MMAKLNARVTSKGQVTIPKAVRDKLGLREGDWLVFEQKDHAFEVRKALLMDEREFERLATDVETRFKERDITRRVIEDAIQWARERK